MDWPARFPDLNPTEHVWDALGRTIATRNTPPRTIQEMKTALLNEWDHLPQEMINCLISSMHISNFINPLTPSGPQNLTTFVYGGFVDIWIREMDSSAFSLFLLTVGGRKRTGA
ncbi:hypothetical protein AVEN_185035-1 [Araneus ventricosus]|uniref:Tc1-like transposase DDE domain-containing protein n=1 Tax=Araneus ventricosus TaxID=182803 RepID=A0A4Y2BQ49_ARAVE|nr:hypothetical protein AVEN_185035-1 [Araneus ventricosus]